MNLEIFIPMQNIQISKAKVSAISVDTKVTKCEPLNFRCKISCLPTIYHTFHGNIFKSEDCFTTIQVKST